MIELVRFHHDNPIFKNLRGFVKEDIGTNFPIYTTYLGDINLGNYFKSFADMYNNMELLSELYEGELLFFEEIHKLNKELDYKNTLNNLNPLRKGYVNCNQEIINLQDKLIQLRLDYMDKLYELDYKSISLDNEYLLKTYLRDKLCKTLKNDEISINYKDDTIDIMFQVNEQLKDIQYKLEDKEVYVELDNSNFPIIELTITNIGREYVTLHILDKLFYS